MGFRHVLAVQGVAVLSAVGALTMPAAAQDWRAAPPAVAKLGLMTVACKGEFCLAVGCRGGKAELVSMSPGGGPFNGAVTVRMPGMSAQLRFVEDPAIMDALNMLGTRALLPANILTAMATQSAITLAGPTFSDTITSTFALKGYAGHAPAIARACGGAAPGQRPDAPPAAE